jgi:hypothetical protein
VVDRFGRGLFALGARWGRAEGSQRHCERSIPIKTLIIVVIVVVVILLLVLALAVRVVKQYGSSRVTTSASMYRRWPTSGWSTR